VTTFDIVEIRKLILGITTEFTGNKSWRFVDRNFVFPNPANPFASSFPEIVNINNFSATQSNVDFVAIKVGDVNCSAAVSLLGNTEERSKGSFVLHATDRTVSKGEAVTVEFSAKDLDVLGFQFTLNFDADALELDELLPGVASNDNFGFTRLDEGVLTASWNGTPTDNSMFSVVFHAKKAGKLSEMLDVNSRYTAAEAYRPNGDLLNVQLAFNASATQQFTLYQNTPNPFKGLTTIGFNLPAAGNASLKITDVSGRVLKSIEREFAEGYNEVQLNSNELPASGVVYYTLKTAGETATKKMIIVD
jgi:hypothetical protein